VRPDVRITWSDGFAIAYQVVGGGSEDVVYLPGFASNVDLMWDIPSYARFLERLASVGRLITLDRRGVGCSDRLAPGSAPTVEEIVDDVLAVMEAASCARVTLFAAQEGAFPALLLAASHPYFVRSLILFGASPSWVRSDDLPDEWSEEEWASALRSFERVTSATETVQGYIRTHVPSPAGDERSGRALVSLFMNTQGIGASLEESRRLSRTDLRGILPSITVPTLVLHREGNEVNPASSGRYLAEHIAGAEYIEIPGRDTQPWLGDQGPIFEAIERFLGVEPPTAASDRRLATVLFTDIVGSTEKQAELGDHGWRELVERHHAVVRESLTRWHGVENDTAGDGFYATFDGPARAIRCALEVAERVLDLGIRVRAGAHAGECEIIEGKYGGITVSIGARVAALAGANEVLVSQTVKDLVAGSGLAFEDAGEHELKGVPDRRHLYRVLG
jgi:class 3 adenylate cyclase